MKRAFTVRNLLTLVAHLQILALWCWGLYAWTVGTLIISTIYLWLMLTLAEIGDQKDKR